MRIAFKEWAVVVDALGRGDQIVLLRKGGINEGRSGFQVEHDRFFLFPTLFHQQRDLVIPAAQARYELLSQKSPPGTVRIEFLAEVVEWRRVESLEAALRLRGRHIWREDVIRERFEFGRSKSLYAMAVRVFRLQLPVDLPMLEHYAGCKSWVELDAAIPTGNALPVLTDREFAQKLEKFLHALEATGAAAASAHK